MANPPKLIIGILGTGAVGGMLAALLGASGNHVVCIGKSRPKKFVSPVFGTHPIRASFVKEYRGRLDVLFITTKASFLVRSLKRVNSKHVGVAIPLLNGVGHSEVIRKNIKAPVATGMIGSVEVSSDGRVIKQLSKQQPHIDIAAAKRASTLLKQIAKALNHAGIETALLKNESEVVWKKLVRLNTIATLTAAAGKPVGFVRTSKMWRPKLVAVLKETAAVAKKEGAAINWQAELKRIDALPKGLTTSLQRDLMANVPSELESITGGVVRLARERAVKVPQLSILYTKICTRYGIRP